MPGILIGRISEKNNQRFKERKDLGYAASDECFNIGGVYKLCMELQKKFAYFLRLDTEAGRRSGVPGNHCLVRFLHSIKLKKTRKTMFIVVDDHCPRKEGRGHATMNPL